MDGKFIAYYRVSTDRQGMNGNGMAAQRKAVEDYLNGGGLMERKVDFVACDMPSANAFMINVYAAVAQEERRMISDRTKAGLAAAKARGVKLGGPRLPAINETRQADALKRARAIAPILSELTGISARAVAAELNARQVETPSGAPWSAKTVIRARDRMRSWRGAGRPPVAGHTPPSGLPPRRPLPRRWAVVSCLPIKIPSLIPRTP
jgi:DNA invertase Pin-like site-specific DNA recombinase